MEWTTIASTFDNFSVFPTMIHIDISSKWRPFSWGILQHKTKYAYAVSSLNNEIASYIRGLQPRDDESLQHIKREVDKMYSTFLEEQTVEITRERTIGRQETFPTSSAPTNCYVFYCMNIIQSRNIMSLGVDLILLKSDRSLSLSWQLSASLYLLFGRVQLIYWRGVFIFTTPPFLDMHFL